MLHECVIEWYLSVVIRFWYAVFIRWLLSFVLQRHKPSRPLPFLTFLPSFCYFPLFPPFSLDTPLSFSPLVWNLSLNPIGSSVKTQLKLNFVHFKRTKNTHGELCLIIWATNRTPSCRPITQCLCCCMFALFSVNPVTLIYDGLFDHPPAGFPRETFGLLA